VDGTAHFGGTLELGKVGAAGVAPFVPITVVEAAAYAGNFTTLRENLEGAVWFNPDNGEVIRSRYTSVLADLSLLAEADLTNQLTVWGLLGASAGIGDDPHALTSRFAKGSRPLQVEADGLSNDSCFFGLGANYKLSDSISIALGYRAEFRPDAHPQSSFGLASAFRF
jgi:hypothetical protein